MGREEGKQMMKPMLSKLPSQDMTDTKALRDRLKDLNTKAYYLLVALSFIYRTSSASVSLKSAFTLTAIVAVLPLQDYVKSDFWLKCFQVLKIVCLTAALFCTLFWIWKAAT
jgi:hypothetical protein